LPSHQGLELSQPGAPNSSKACESKRQRVHERLILGDELGQGIFVDGLSFQVIADEI